MRETSHCYCSLWQTAPETLRQQGLPEGFCGLCSVCGAPGHLRAHPSAPISDAWCDTCFETISAAGTPWLARVIPVFVVLVTLAILANLVWRHLG